MAFGVALAGAIFFGALRLGLVPGLTADGRARSLDMGTITFTAGMGDLFLHRKGLIAPPPDPYLVLSEHRLAWDADGFRLPALASPDNTYEIVALGDSFTEAANAARPWPDVLAAETGKRVRNLGFRGYGPVEEGRVLRDYGLKSKPRLVILGYFEGNDLNDVVSVRWRDPSVLPALARAEFAPYDPKNPIWASENAGPFPYPIHLDLNGTRHEMAFLDDYLSWLNADPATYTQSDNLNALGVAIDDIVATLKAAPVPTCLLMAYFPEKTHIYLPYVVPEDRAGVASTVEFRSLERPGSLIIGGRTGSSYEDIVGRLGNQRDAVAALVAARGMSFLDLTPAFAAAAARGEVLYYTYDTHWNQAGHDLAGRTIAAYLSTRPDPCA
jgi:hypothetical protein